MPLRDVIRELFRFRTVNYTYLASGFQMFVLGAIIAWAPSYLNRYYGIDPAQAAVRAAVLVLMAGIGMTLGGIVVDRLSARQPSNRLRLPRYMRSYAGAFCSSRSSCHRVPRNSPSSPLACSWAPASPARRAR